MFIFMVSFGLTSGFACIYWANSIFPIKYASQTFTICNMTARICTIFSPVISGLQGTNPTIILMVLVSINALLQTQIKLPKNK